MDAGLQGYGRLIADRPALRFSAAGFLARMPLAMTGLGIVLLVSLTTGSYGRSGLLAAAGTLTGAVAAPLWGRAIDRVGQARVLVLAALVNSSSLSLLTLAVLRDWPLGAAVAAAVGVGIGFSSAGSAVRARWSARLGDTPLLQTAFALEAVLDEVVFLLGPPLVTVLATRVHPASGVAVAAVVGLAGAALLAAQRGTAPPLHAHAHAAGRPPLPWRIVLPVTGSMVAMGVVFGATEVVVVAFAREHGLLPLAGGFIAAWSLGSLLAGVATGSVAWRSPPARRFRLAATALMLSVLPLPFVGSPLLLAGLMLVGGVTIAPTLIASVAVVQAAVPPGRLTEALGWTSTGLAVGLAAGAATAGQLIDLAGSGAGFGVVSAAGVALVLSLLALRTPPAGRSERPPGPAASAEAGEVAVELSPGVGGPEAGGGDLVEGEQAVPRTRGE